MPYIKAQKCFKCSISARFNGISTLKNAYENPQNVEAYLNYLMIGKYVERIADHSTNVAEWIIYIVKNELK